MIASSPSAGDGAIMTTSAVTDSSALTGLLVKDDAADARARRMRIARHAVVIVGGAIAALMSGSPNAFDVVVRNLQADTHTSDIYASILLGIGAAGLQLSLFAGMLIDRRGPVVATMVGGVAVVGGYWLMSITESPALLLAEYAVISLGSGATFLSALSAAIQIGHPAGIALVSLTMSLSISFVVFLATSFGDNGRCDMSEAGCWREYVRVWACVAAGAFAVGCAALRMRVRPEEEPAPPAPEGADFADRAAAARLSGGGGGGGAPRTSIAGAVAPRLSTGSGSAGVGGRGSVNTERHVSAASRVSSALQSLNSVSIAAVVGAENLEFNVPMSFREGLRIFKKGFFWALTLGYCCGIGAGIITITSAHSLYDEYNNDKTKIYWNQLITVYFSFFSASANVVAPFLSDFLHTRGIIRRSRFIGVLLLLVAADFSVLGAMSMLPHNHVGDCALKYAFVMIMASVGAGFGSFLTLFPACLSDVYGFANFGTLMSYMQLFAAVFAVAAPMLVSGIRDLAGSAVPVYFGMSTLLLGTGMWMCVAQPFSASFPQDAKPQHTL